MLVGGVVVATVLAKSTLTVASAATATPSPGAFTPNENATHEAGEPAARETA
jgi:hypothetical protein